MTVAELAAVLGLHRTTAWRHARGAAGTAKIWRVWHSPDGRTYARAALAIPRATATAIIEEVLHHRWHRYFRQLRSLAQSHEALACPWCASPAPPCSSGILDTLLALKDFVATTPSLIARFTALKLVSETASAVVRLSLDDTPEL